MPAPTLTDQTIIDLYRSGVSMRKIAASNERIHRVLTDNNVPLDLKSRAATERQVRLRKQLDVIIADYEAGATMNDLAATYGTTREAIYQAMKKSGVRVVTRAERKRQAERERWKRLMDAPEIVIAPETASRTRKKLNQRRIEEALAHV